MLFLHQLREAITQDLADIKQTELTPSYTEVTALLTFSDGTTVADVVRRDRLGRLVVPNIGRWQQLELVKFEDSGPLRPVGAEYRFRGEEPVEMIINLKGDSDAKVS